MDSHEELDQDGLAQLQSQVEANVLPNQAPTTQSVVKDEESADYGPPGYIWTPPEEPEDQEPFDSFPDEVRKDVEGLTWLGYLEDEFEFCGHHFVIRTLRADEELLASVISREYIETLGQAKAWAWANVCLALESVDYDETFCPPTGPDKQKYAKARFQWVTSRWYWPVGEYLFRRYADLVERMNIAVDAMANLS